MTQIADRTMSFIGKIPKDWDTLPLKSFIRRKEKRNKPDLQLLSVYRDYGVIPKDSRDDNYNKASLDLTNYRVVEKGDLVLNKMKTWQGSLGVSDHEGLVSPAYYVCKVSSKRVNKRFLHYLLRSKSYIAIYACLSKGIRPNQWDLPYDNFKQILALIPPLNYQKKIVSFLNSKLELSSDIIQKNKKLIELLEEKRQAIITQAVTKGIDLNAEMKDSGVEWIGRVPKKWNFKRFKLVFGDINGCGFPVELQGQERGDYPFYKVSDINKGGAYLRKATNYVDENLRTKRNWRLVPSNSIVTAKIGAALSLNHRKITTVNCLIDNNMLALLPIDKQYSLDYLFYLLQIINFDLFVNPGAVPSVNMNQLRNFILPKPSKHEQKLIIKHLEVKLTEIKKLKKLAKEQNKKIAEYRQALINSAVTGKIRIN